MKKRNVSTEEAIEHLTLVAKEEATKPKPETFEKLHHKPVTRRDFLASGLIGFSGSMVVPSMLAILARSGNAQAQESLCNVVSGSGLCAFVSIKLSGGMAMSANFLPLDQGGQLLQSYSKMGMGAGATLPVAYEFANQVPFYANSSLLTGLRTAGPLVLANSNFVGACVRSQDDNSGNKADFTGLVISAGLQGSLLPNLGRANTPTGANQVFAYTPPPAPLVVGRYEDVSGSLGVSGSLAALNNPQKAALFNSIKDVSTIQAQAYLNMTGGSLLSRLLGCANAGNVNLVSNTASLNIDPLGNAQFAQIFNINANSNKGSQDFVAATLLFNTLNGNASTCNIDMGGYDYHNGTRVSGDAKDLEAGIMIARVLQGAALLGKKVFIAVTSDGSVTSADSQIAGSPWTSDRGSAGAAYMISYDPAGAHQIKSNQLGFYNNGQAADETFITGGSAELTAAAMFANYTAFNGRLNMFETWLPRIFTTAQLDVVTRFT